MHLQQSKKPQSQTLVGLYHNNYINLDYKMITLIKEGFYITNNDDVDIKDRILSDSMYFPDSADTSVYKFITEEEYNEYKKEQEAAIMADMEKNNVN